MSTTKLIQETTMKAPILPQIMDADLTKVFIGLGAGVDPDGLASQAAMAAIIRHINPDADIHLFYRGDWDRAQNRTMREILGLNPKPYSELESIKDAFTCVIMVDGNKNAMLPGSEPDFVIDHHEGDAGAKVDSDVRLIGSCSAIMWEYIMETDPDILEGEDGAELATALAIGIITDTQGKTADKTSRLDWEAEAYCGMRCDIKAYSSIINYQKPSYQKDMETQAWNDKVVSGTVLTTQLGVIPPGRKGVISSCAEEFCGQGPFKTALAAAMIDGDVHFSIRTFNTSLSVDGFIKSQLTKNGKDGSGGGKPGAGAGVIKMPEVIKRVPAEIQKEIFDAAYKAISHALFEFVGDGVRSDENE
jgi:nanoRNase/pAp phosphatase (c-di-AMP/oligoRNAs hydrolase)